MAKSITQYNIFLASPSDVKSEREAVEEVIKELNLSSAAANEINLRLIRWETDVYPAFADYSQEVINSQINDDYDIFIGIMWSKFGSPTKNSDSGTKEEFLRAHKKWEADRTSVKIMIYFNNSPIPQDDLDIEQFKAVREFKKEVADKGGIYTEYKDSEEFKQLLRIHLNKVISEFVRPKTGIADIKHLENKIEDELDDELGLFESLDISNDSFSELTIVTEKITSYLNELTGRMNRRTEQIDKIMVKTPDVQLKEAPRIINLAAQDLLNFVDRTQIEIPIFKELFEKGIKAFSNAYTIWSTFEPEKFDDIKENIVTLEGGLQTGIDGMTSLMIEIQKLPKITTPIIKASKAAVKVSNDLIKEFEFALQLTKEFHK